MFSMEPECEGGCGECMAKRSVCESCKIEAQEGCYWHAIESARPGLAKARPSVPPAEEVAF
jgi:hypothetical protein